MNDESTPKGAPESFGGDTPSIARESDAQRLTRRHGYGLLVISERQDGVLMSQVFTNLPAAERKVTRTRERNLFASIALVRIVPVPYVSREDLTVVDGGAA